MSIHSGHRARLKKRFAQYGERAFDDHQLLELLLFYAVPQGDVNPLAHRLIQHFGSFAAVLDAKVDELVKVDGVGEHTALLLTMMPQIMRRYQLSHAANEAIITSSADAGEYLLPYFFGARNEMVYLLSLDAKGKVISCDLLGEGNLDQVLLNSRQVVETALERRAISVVLAHNHPTGLAFPSNEDISATMSLRPLLKSLHIQLLDHIVVADGDFVSMRESGYFTSR